MAYSNKQEYINEGKHIGKQYKKYMRAGEPYKRMYTHR